MKQIFTKVKKGLCLILGITLMTSNTLVFSQTYLGNAETTLIEDMERLYNMADDLKKFEESMDRLENILDNPGREINRVMSMEYDIGKNSYIISRNSGLGNIIEQYRSLITNYYEGYVEALSIIERGPNATVASSRQYSNNFLTETSSAACEEEILEIQTGLPREIFHYDPSSQIAYVDEDALTQAKFVISNLRAKTAKMKEGIRISELAKEEIFRTRVSPEDIMRYAFTTEMLPKEKAGIRLTLQAMDEGIQLPTLVGNIRGYLREFGNTVKNHYSSKILTRELRGMSAAERTLYVNELTGLDRGSKQFINDFIRLDRSTKKSIAKNIAEGLWGVAIIGSILTAFYITDVVTDNQSNSGTVRQRELAEIGRKIEEGTASETEKWLFFTNPISDGFIQTNPIYTLNFVRLVSEVYEADKLLEEMDIQENEQQEQQGNIENQIINDYQPTIDRLNRNLQIGTL